MRTKVLDASSIKQVIAAIEAAIEKENDKFDELRREETIIEEAIYELMKAQKLFMKMLKVELDSSQKGE